MEEDSDEKSNNSFVDLAPTRMKHPTNNPTEIEETIAGIWFESLEFQSSL